MTRLAARLRAAIPLDLLAYLGALALLLGVAWLSVADLLERREQVAASADLLAQLEGRRPAGTAGGLIPTAPMQTGSPLLDGATNTVAGAQLMQRLTEAMTRAGGTILSSQIDAQALQAPEGYVSLVANGEIGGAALQGFLYDLETGMPFLFIEQLSVETGTASGEAGRMKVLIAVAGYWRGAS